MNTKAIERINGYCCEVNEQQWEELARVADEVGVDVHHVGNGNALAAVDVMGVLCRWHSLRDRTIIPFPDFLAKLRGSEEWQPKAGEMVEVKIDGQWCSREYIGYKHDRHFVWSPPRSQYFVEPSLHVRPLRPTITREEAEKQLGKRIID